jgi:hypothetical protein
MAQMSIPAFHVSNKSKVKGDGSVSILSRQSGAITGVFVVGISANFDPSIDDYPIGTLTIEVDLTDGSIGKFTATTVELINSFGRQNPTVCLTGRCKSRVTPAAKGCRYWISLADNKRVDAQGTPDTVSFAIHDRDGNRVAYGTGPVRTGDFHVEAA